MAQIEEMWGHLDTLFSSLSASHGWEQRHGADWTLADGTATVAPGMTADADLVLTQSAETWEKTLRGIQNSGGWLSKNLVPKPLPYHQYQGHHTAASSPAIPASLL